MAIVAKFGGTSVATATKLRQMVKFVEADPERKYVVVSAAGKRHQGDHKVTDLLRECNRLRNSGQAKYREVLRSVFDRHSEIIRDLGLKLDLSPVYARIGEATDNGASDDHLESRGEYLMGVIAAEMLGWPLVDPTRFITFGENGFLEALTYERTAKVLGEFPMAVIPGYYGGMLEDPYRTRVFPRGGSDISGAIVARGVNAKRYENCTDVYGVYAADPRVVEDPITIASMTYREIQELAFKGASVLHPDALFPVMEAGIPTHVLNTADPGGRHTEIVQDVPHRNGMAVGIAGRQGFSIISVRSIKRQMLKSEVGFTWNILGVLKDLNLSYEHSTDSPDSVSIIIEDEQLENKFTKLCDEIYAIYPNIDLCPRRDASMLAVVGEGMVQAVGTAAKIFSSLAKEGVNVLTIGQGASEMVVTITVESGSYETAMRTLYRDCVEK